MARSASLGVVTRNGVAPWNISAPSETSPSPQLLKPWCTARCSAVRPSASKALTIAPARESKKVVHGLEPGPRAHVQRALFCRAREDGRRRNRRLQTTLQGARVARIARLDQPRYLLTRRCQRPCCCVVVEVVLLVLVCAAAGKLLLRAARPRSKRGKRPNRKPARQRLVVRSSGNRTCGRSSQRRRRHGRRRAGPAAPAAAAARRHRHRDSRCGRHYKRRRRA